MCQKPRGPAAGMSQDGLFRAAFGAHVTEPWNRERLYLQSATRHPTGSLQKPCLTWFSLAFLHRFPVKCKS